MTEDSENAILVSAKELEQLMCILYLIAFLSDLTKDGSALDPERAFFDSSSEVNAMHPAFAKKSGLVMRITNIGAQKIDGTTLETYKMVVAVFSVTNQANRIKFFEKTFLVANVSPDIVFGIPFFTLSSADVDFLKREL